VHRLKIFQYNEIIPVRNEREGGTRKESEITVPRDAPIGDFLLYGSGRVLLGNLFHAVKPPSLKSRAMASIQDRKVVIQPIN